MSFSTLFRFNGGVLIVGSGLSLAGFLLHPSGNTPVNYLSSIWLPANLLILVGALLVALGLPGIYARQAEQAGKLGLLGFALTFFVIMLFNIASGTVETFILPALAAHASTSAFLSGSMPASYNKLILVALLLELVGPLLLGIATLRAKVFPRWTAWLLMATPVLVLVGFFVSLPGPLAQLDAIALNLALLGMGASLLVRQAIVTHPVAS